MNIFLNKNFFQKIYLFGIFLITMLPVLALPPLFHPADWGKSIVFKIIFSFLLFFFIVQFLYQKNFKQLVFQKIKNIPKWFLFPFLCFGALIIISTIFALEPFFSFWGSPYRAGGSLNLLLYMVFAIFSYVVVEKKDWSKIWISAVIGGLAVSFIAICQQFGLLSENLVKYPFRPPSTMGNTNFLAVYLILLLYLPLAFGIKADTLFKKIFYFAGSAIFLFIILMTISKAAYIGVILGILWFLSFTKFKNSLWNKLKWALAGLPILAVILLLFFANTPNISSKITQQNQLLGDFVDRFTLDKFIEDVRFSGWKIGLQTLQDRPLLGYGSENFSIGFDKYYDPSLPGLKTLTGGQWWDRAHNFLLDIAVTMGIPALLAYLFFWTYLFLKLQKVKKKNPTQYLIPHLLQATFISYFASIFFGFDCVPTYIISYLLIGYCLSIISPDENTVADVQNQNRTEIKITDKKNILIAFLFIFLIFFVWQYNIVPLKVNAQINWANYYLKKDKTCNRAADSLKPYLNSHTIASSFLYQTYGSVIIKCIKETSKLSDKVELAKQGIETDQKLIKERPYFVRSWIYLGSLEAFLLESDPKNKDSQNKMNGYFSKAVEMSPRRTNIFLDWANGYLSYGNCKEALGVSQTCLQADENYRDCWWVSALSNICLKNQKLGEEQIKIAKEKGYDVWGIDAMKQLSTIYVRLTQTEKNNLLYYNYLADTYVVLSRSLPKDFQIHASLAYVYRILGKYDLARYEASIVIKLEPKAKEQVEAFLKTIP